MQRGEPPANEPRPSIIRPPVQSLGKPLQAGTIFGEGIHSLLQGMISNPVSLSSPIAPQPQTTTPVPSNPPIIPISVAPPIQIQTTTMSAQPVTAQATITTPANNKTNLQGKQPPVFDGTRSKADNFWRAFKIYRILNKETNMIKNPFHRTALAISFIAGPNIDDWAKSQLDLLRSSPKRSRSRILVSKGYRVRVSHVSVNPSCRVSKWTES